MSLQKQNVPIKFAGGIDTKTDPKQVVPGKLLTLENGIFTSTDRIKKRFGYLFLNSAIAGRQNLGSFAGPSLGVADSFVTLASSTITNTGFSVLTGNLGLSPGTSVIGFPPGTVNGVQHINDALAIQAQVDLTLAYNNLAARPLTTNLTGIDLGGLTLGPGVYRFTSSAQLTGTLTLDAQSNPNALFIFQIGSTLTTASSSSVVMINGGVPGNIFWQVGSSATIGTSSAILGNILAQVSITLTTAATLSGRALARTGAVTMDTNIATRASNSSQITLPAITPNIIKGLGISTFKDELIEFTGTEIFSYSDSLKQWEDKGATTSLNVGAFSVIRNSYRQTTSDSAVHPSGLEVFTWEDSSGGARYNVMDTLTGQVLVQNQAIAPNASKPKPIALGAYIIILYIDTVSHNLLMLPINILTPTQIAAPVGISTDVNVTFPNYDATTIGSNVFIAYNTSDGGGGIATRFITPTLGISTETVVTGENANGCIGIFGDPVTSQVWVVYYNGTSVKYFIRYYLNISTFVLPPTTIETIANVVNITGISPSNGQADIFYTLSAAATYNYLIHTATLTTTGILSGVSVFMRSVGITTKPFLFNNTVYLNVAFESTIQTTYFTINLEKHIVAKYSPGVGGGLLVKNMVPEVNTLSTGKFLIASLQKDLLTTISGTVYTQTGVTAITLDFNASNTFFTAELANNLQITGGYVSMYDGVSVVEHGFYVFPENVTNSSATTGGSVNDGQHQYSVVYEWIDNQGQTQLSAPSIPLTVVNTGGNLSTNTLTIPTLRLTAKIAPRSPVIIGVYRTETNGTIFYKISSITSPLFNDPTVDTVSYVDTVADSIIVGNQLLYTTGGVVENIAAPATNLMTTYKNRVIVVPSENKLSFWPSKEVVPGLPVEFSDLFAQNIDQRGGDITAPAVLDDKLILFKRTSIFFVNGDGPDATGGGGTFSPAQLITTDGGCIDSKSVVLMPYGLMYKSEKGIYLLDRSLAVAYIGADVEGFNNDTITSAALIPNTNQVRFCLDSGVTLVYDYRVGQWSVFTNIAAIDSTIFQNQFTYLKSNGIVAQETPGLFADGIEFIKLKLVTSWLSFAGLQGFQRVRKLLLLGEYASPHQLYVQVAYDFNPYATQEDYIDATALMNPLAYGVSTPYGADDVYGGQFPLYQFRVDLERQKCETVQFSIEDTQLGTMGEGFSISSMAFEVGAKQGLDKIGASRSFG